MQTPRESQTENKGVCSYEVSWNHKSDRMYLLVAKSFRIYCQTPYGIYPALRLLHILSFRNRVWWESALTTFLAFLKQTLSKTRAHQLYILLVRVDDTKKNRLWSNLLLLIQTSLVRVTVSDYLHYGYHQAYSAGTHCESDWWQAVMMCRNGGLQKCG